MVMATLRRLRPRGPVAAGCRWEVWLLLPAAVLAAAPALILALIGRRFTWWQLALAMPDIMIFLAVAAMAGTALLMARLRAGHSAGRP
jgi:hypothetical protein